MRPLVTARMRSLVLADRGLAECPAGRATSATLAERLSRPLGEVSRALRDAERCGVVGSTITLSERPGRDRVFWLTADKGIGLVRQTSPGEGADA
jgi:hypothetical protein